MLKRALEEASDLGYTFNTGPELEFFLLRFRRLLDAAERRIAETGGVPHDELWSAIEHAGAPLTPGVAEKKPRYRPRAPRSSNRRR